MGDARLLLYGSGVLSGTSTALPLPFREFMKLGAFQASASCEGVLLVSSPGGGEVVRGMMEVMTSDCDSERLGEPENSECIDELEGCGEVSLMGLCSSDGSSGACEGEVCTIAGISTLSTMSTSIISGSSAIDCCKTWWASRLVSDG